MKLNTSVTAGFARVFPWSPRHSNNGRGEGYIETTIAPQGFLIVKKFGNKGGLHGRQRKTSEVG